MCDHSEYKDATYLPVFTLHEIYMCECGVLIDLSDGAQRRDNVDYFVPLTSEQVAKYIQEELQSAEDAVEAIRDCIALYDLGE